MSESEQSRVFFSEGDDPEMQLAHENARANFRYFWREIAWERRRIVPALDLAVVKAPFSDGRREDLTEETPEVEHMWISDIDFDGRALSGTLMNSPNWLKSIEQGDTVRVPLGQISDWMYVIRNEVFGAYTVNLLRSRMSRRERQEHDDAWGLNFGDPERIRIVPEAKANGGGIWKSWFGKQENDTGEHPMSVNMAESLKAQIAKDPSLVSATDDRGWTLLHQEALAGSAPTVKVLLEAGADPRAVTQHGATPLRLAKALGWENVIAILSQA